LLVKAEIVLEEMESEFELHGAFTGDCL